MSFVSAWEENRLLGNLSAEFFQRSWVTSLIKKLFILNCFLDLPFFIDNDKENTGDVFDLCKSWKENAVIVICTLQKWCMYSEHLELLFYYEVDTKKKIYSNKHYMLSCEASIYLTLVLFAEHFFCCARCSWGRILETKIHAHRWSSLSTECVSQRNCGNSLTPSSAIT